MAKLIIIKNHYDTDTALKNVLEYTSDNSKSYGYEGAQNMLLNNCIEQIEAVNKYFYKTFKKKVLHFIISFAPYEYISTQEAFDTAYRICALLPEYQIRFSVHQNTDNLHIHFAMNPTSLVDGHRFYFDRTSLFFFMRGLRKIFDEYEIKISYVFSEYRNEFMFSEQLNYGI